MNNKCINFEVHAFNEKKIGKSKRHSKKSNNYIIPTERPMNTHSIENTDNRQINKNKLRIILIFVAIILGICVIIS